MSKLLTVIAIGNSHAGDDGIGLMLLDAVKNQLLDTVNVNFWEDKDSLSVAAELLEINTPVMIVDCADMGLRAGEYRCFNVNDVQLNGHMQSISTHGLGFAEAFQLAQTLGFTQSLSVFAIQPEQLEPGEKLSPVLEQKKNQLAAALLQEIQHAEQETRGLNR